MKGFRPYQSITEPLTSSISPSHWMHFSHFTTTLPSPNHLRSSLALFTQRSKTPYCPGLSLVWTILHWNWTQTGVWTGISVKGWICGWGSPAGSHQIIAIPCFCQLHFSENKNDRLRPCIDYHGQSYDNLRDMLDRFFIVYIDNIQIFYSNFQQNLVLESWEMWIPPIGCHLLRSSYQR